MASADSGPQFPVLSASGGWTRLSRHTVSTYSRTDSNSSATTMSWRRLRSSGCERSQSRTRSSWSFGSSRIGPQMCDRTRVLLETVHPGRRVEATPNQDVQVPAPTPEADRLRDPLALRRLAKRRFRGSESVRPAAERRAAPRPKKSFPRGIGVEGSTQVPTSPRASVCRTTCGDGMVA